MTTYRTFSYSPTSNTDPVGITNAGVVYGSYSEASMSGGFTYSDGSFTALATIPAAVSSLGHSIDVGAERDPNVGAGGPAGLGGSSIVDGINDLGQTVGYYTFFIVGPPIAPSNYDIDRGYVHVGSTYTDVVAPPVLAPGTTIAPFSGTFAKGINNLGQIAGYYNNSPIEASHGFLDTNGQFATIDYPGATDTQVDGINNRGDLVGTYSNGSGSHGFYYTGGNYTSIDGPSGAQSFTPTGINDQGQIVGHYVDPASGHDVGFVTDPISVTDPIIHLSSSFRFFDTATGDHFYTSSVAEANQIGNSRPTYHYEGSPWSTPDAGPNTTDVFRFFDVATGTHFLTSSLAERNQVMATLPSYHYEGVAFEAYNAPGDGALAVERFVNAQTHLHHYAASAAEITSILAGGAGPGWVDEGIGFFVHA
jgi:Repeat of unknown function (DUF5648)